MASLSGFSVVGIWWNEMYSVQNEFKADGTVHAPAIIGTGWEKGTWSTTPNGIKIIFINGKKHEFRIQDQNTMLEQTTGSIWRRQGF